MAKFPPRRGWVVDGVGYIPLSKGAVAIVDPHLVPHLSSWNWCVTGKRGKQYAMRSEWVPGGKPRSIFLHRYVMDAGPGVEVDHVSGNTLDDRRTNLRVCTRGLNGRNIQNCRPHSSQFKGVSWDRTNSRWIAYIKVDYRLKNLGRYDSELEAARAYDRAAVQLHGDFACLNGV